MGPCKGLYLRSSRLPLANLRSSATPVYLYHGPMQAFLSAVIWLTEIYAGTCYIHVATHIVVNGLMCANCKKPMACEWAHARASTQDSFRLLLANSGSSAAPVHFASWVNVSIFLSSHLANWNVCGPIQHSHAAAHIMLDGPMCANCEKPMLHGWAHARACT